MSKRFVEKKNSTIMTTLNYKILPTRRKASGKLGIYLAVSHRKQVRYISTEFEIDDEHQFQDGKICYRKDAAIMNKCMQYVMDEYLEKLSHINPAACDTCTAIKDALTSETGDTRSITLESMFKDKQKRLLECGRIRHAAIIQASYKAVTSIIRPDTPIIYLTPNDVRILEEHFVRKGFSAATINIYLSNMRAAINELIDGEVLEMKNPFRKYVMPSSPARLMDISRDDFIKLVENEITYKNMSFAKDMWLLSFYLGGMNLEDMKRTVLSNDEVVYVRKKTENKKRGCNKQIVFSIVPEAREIINKYLDHETGLIKLRYDKHEIPRIDTSLKLIAQKLNIEGRFSFYSARKTFAQFAFEIGIRTEVIEYCLGQSMKSNRPVYNYVRVMQKYADEAIRAVIDYAHSGRIEKRMEVV